MIYRIGNLTSIDYAAPVSQARFNLRLRPALWPTQRLLSYSLDISPTAKIREEQGPYVVNTSRLALDGTTDAIRIAVQMDVEVLPPAIDAAQAPAPTIAAIRAAAIADCELSPTSPCSYIFASSIARPAEEIARNGPGRC